MPCVRRKLLALAVFTVIALIPSASFAATTCECFCGAEGSGAVSADRMQKEQCQETCDTLAGDWRYVGCFTDAAEYPVESDKCWTQAECEAWSDERNGVTVNADWGDTFPADCSTTKTSGEEMHYCYANDVPYDLNVDIGNVGTVQNLPDYINIVYTWMLPAASLIAVVMMMIGGLQYTLARGKAKYIDKAKTRITNAITGIVILLSAFVILNLIDPRLVSFDALRIPMLKEVTILDAMSSCERLADVGYGVDPDPETTKHYCGEKGTVNSVSGLDDNAIGSWKEGDSCDFQACENAGEVCISEDGTNACASCADNATPTSSTCAAIEELNTGTDSDHDGQGDSHAYCRYSSELNSCLGVSPSGRSQSYFNCDSLRALASSSTEHPGCSYYETLKLTTKDGSESLASEHGAELLQEICELDPCTLYAEDESGTVANPSGCYYGVGNPDGTESVYSCRTF